MSDYGDLFSHEYGPGHKAHDHISSIIAAGKHPLVREQDRLNALIQHYLHPEGLIDEKLSRLMHRRLNSANKRRGELVKDQYLTWNGQFLMTTGHSPAKVWQITELGIAAVDYFYPRLRESLARSQPNGGNNNEQAIGG